MDENAKPSRGTTEPGTELPGGGERVEHPSIDRLHRIQRFRDIGEQDLRVVVRLLHRHPRK
jgi:hypothetical protein